MSAYTTEPRAGSIPHPGNPEAGVLDKLDAFVSATKQLESALHHERLKRKEIEIELKRNHELYDRLLKESEARNRELSLRENKTKSAIDESNALNAKTQAQLVGIYGELKNTKAELAQYKAAWSEVLRREREAKEIIAELDLAKRKVQELETKNKSLVSELSEERPLREQAERHSKSYQNELQNALLRVHSAEAKFSEMSKELQLQYQSKRNFDDEIAKIETSMKERFQWALIKERERIKAETEKDAVIEREKVKDELRRKLRAEADQELAAERERNARRIQQLEQETAIAMERLAEAEKAAERAIQESGAAILEADEKASTERQAAISAVNRELERVRADLSALELKRATELERAAAERDAAIERERSASEATLREQRELTARAIRSVQEQIASLAGFEPYSELIQVNERDLQELANELGQAERGSADYRDLEEMLDYLADQNRHFKLLTQKCEERSAEHLQRLERATEGLSSACD